MAALINDEGDKAVGGRPRAYPDWVLIVYLCAISLAGSASATQVNFRDGWWELIRTSACEIGLPGAENLSSSAPRRHHFRYFVEKRLTVPMVQKLMQALMLSGLWTARECGALIPNGRPDLSAPHRPNVVGHDGKSMISPVKPRTAPRVDKSTGEILRTRFDPAASLHGQGGDEAVTWGTKFGVLSTRNPQGNERFYLGVHHIAPGRDYAGESALAVDALTLLHKAAALTSAHGEKDSGIHAIVNDAAMRGTHIDQLQTTMGIPVLAPTVRPSKGMSKIRHAGRTYKARRLDAVPCKHGGPDHVLWAAGGAIYEETRTVDGTPEYNQLAGTNKRQRSGQKWIMSASVTIPCRHGDHRHYERITATQSDVDTGYNRAEYFRWFPQDGDDYTRVYPMRSDTESSNRELKNVFPESRIAAYGARKQLFLMIGWAFMRNVRALEVHSANPARIPQAA